METKKKVYCVKCGARDLDGMCVPVGTPCNSVAHSLCEPIKRAFELGYSFRNCKVPEFHAFGVCPFCNGTPVIKKPNWFERVVLRHGPSVVCSKCGSELLSVNDVFTSEEIVIHLPE